MITRQSSFASCWRFSSITREAKHVTGGRAPVRTRTPSSRSMLLPRRSAIFLRRSLFLGAAGMLSSASAATSTPPRLKPMVPPDLDASQQRLYDTIVDTRVGIVGKAALFDEQGALRGPWNAEVASPALGQHLERLATAVRSENSLEPRLYEVTALWWVLSVGCWVIGLV